jgi:flagellar basal-body rod modification protein FlgD
MTVTAASGTTAAAGTTSTKSLAGNFDTFLKLLTTQLKQQDPLSPMDATTFTSQLVQFASVEQAIQTNTKLADLAKLAETTSATSALSLLGQEVTATTDKISLAAEGDAEIRYRLPEAATETTVTVLDAKGQVVATLEGGANAGENALAWNGQGTDGLRLAAGSYTVKVAAKAADGSELAVEQFVRGPVQAVERVDSELRIRVADALVPFGAVSLVQQPAQPS